MIDPGRRAELQSVLATARQLGFLGPGPVDDHIERSMAFVRGWSSYRSDPPTAVLDLGSGGGVPGLVLAVAWPDSQVTLLDGSERRVAFLQERVDALGLSHHVRALARRAEEAARSALRGTYELVSARGFGPPAVTAECGAGFLSADGLLIVAEPPGGDAARWPGASLASLGLEAFGLLTDPATVQILRRVGPLPDRYPRRVGIPAKRPLWA